MILRRPGLTSVNLYTFFIIFRCFYIASLTRSLSWSREKLSRSISRGSCSSSSTLTASSSSRIYIIFSVSSSSIWELRQHRIFSFFTIMGRESNNRVQNLSPKISKQQYLIKREKKKTKLLDIKLQMVNNLMIDKSLFSWFWKVFIILFSMFFFQLRFLFIDLIIYILLSIC